MKVIYKERYFIDRYCCIDRVATRHFDTSWKDGGLTYFKLGKFTIFTIETDFIIGIE